MEKNKSYIDQRLKFTLLSVWFVLFFFTPILLQRATALADAKGVIVLAVWKVWLVSYSCHNKPEKKVHRTFLTKCYPYHRACRFWIDLSVSTKAQTFLFTAKKIICCIMDPRRKGKEPRSECDESRLFLTAKRHKKALFKNARSRN